VREYLGDRPSLEQCQDLIESISGLIYSDGEVATEEAKLLTIIQDLARKPDHNQTIYTSLLRKIQKLYRRWVDVQN
jgi:hypothetical protein